MAAAEDKVRLQNRRKDRNFEMKTLETVVKGGKDMDCTGVAGDRRQEPTGVDDG